MFDLPCGVRLRNFRSSAEEYPPYSGGSSDLENILRLHNDKDIAPHVTDGFIVPQGQKLKDRFKNIIENDAEMFCVIESTPPLWKHWPNEPHSNCRPGFLGFAALWARAERGHRHSSFSIVLFPQCQNKGVGTAVTQFMVDYAFVHLNMHRVSLSLFEGNDRALAIYRKCGFVEEGRSRKTVWKAGKWVDSINMGILIEDWEALRAQRLDGLTP